MILNKDLQSAIVGILNKNPKEPHIEFLRNVVGTTSWQKILKVNRTIISSIIWELSSTSISNMFKQHYGSSFANAVYTGNPIITVTKSKK